ncbi:MAG: deoxyribonuclease IV [Actinobacteria bacterium]|nr:MAG: deoxyribonuclease IV [Actinomycetota bacterium]
MRIGVHVRTGGDLASVADRAVRIGCETVQIFSGNPRSWTKGSLDARGARILRRSLDEQSIFPLFVHASYLPNLASPDEALYERSILLVAEELVRTSSLAAQALVLHLGSAGRGERDASAVPARIAAGLRRAYEISGVAAPTLVENSSGGGASFGSNFAEIAVLLQLLPGLPVGVALDTAHASAAGYCLDGGDGWRGLLDEIEASVGLDSLGLIHANDSRSPCGSRLDRHWHIGEGTIGEEGFRAMGRARELAHLPVILETPGHEEEVDRENLAKMKRLVRD